MAMLTAPPVAHEALPDANARRARTSWSGGRAAGMLARPHRGARAMRLAALVVAGLVLLPPTLARAQAQPGAPPPPLSWRVDSLRSTALGAGRRYFVALPPNYAQTTAKYPVLVLLDADDAPQFT